MEGSIESWNTSGFGIIRGADGKTYLAHYSNFLEKGKKIAMEIGQDVSFTPDDRQAIGISYDSRSALFRFARFYNFEKSIDELASEHAVGEIWSAKDFKENELRGSVEETADRNSWFKAECKWQSDKGYKVDEIRARNRVADRIDAVVYRKKYEILISFLERTFERVKLERKITHHEDMAVFNTALGNRFNRDIYAVFKTKQNEKGDFLWFDRFADENFVGKIFPKIPEAPNYFIDAATGNPVPSDHFFLDAKLRLFADDKHLFDERRSRFPPSWEGMDDVECSSSFERLLERTQRRVRRNFRAAVPFYYPALRTIQMLLPITFDPGADHEVTLAAVVARVGAGYSVETIMPLDWAYKNARLLAKPDRDDWLNF